ncbi:discoidin domain-containing protein [Actinoplanes missouriensis]|uniref:discoidin domain-containing protein n=1 Tax=Actinoplanes missouriensis TaxID=1866 RepID=UPI0002FBEE30|nr:discoidin domain-containing protein [Actinoplanes missouriensis]
MNGFGNAPDSGEGSGTAGERRASRADSLRLTRMPQRPVARTSDPAGPGAPPAFAAPARDAAVTTSRAAAAAPAREAAGKPERPGGGRKRGRRIAVATVVVLVALVSAGWAYRMEIAEAGSEPASSQVAEPVPSEVRQDVTTGVPTEPLTESAQTPSPPPSSAKASPAASAKTSPSAPAGKANPGGANLALDGVASASAVEGDRWGPANAIDGDETTRWSSGFSDPQWIKVDLRQRWRISAVTLLWEHAYGVAYRVETSPDGKKWTSIYTTKSGKGGKVDIAAEGETARYIRVYGTKRNTSYGYSLLELRVT